MATPRPCCTPRCTTSTPWTMFFISLQAEKRTVVTTGPAWPNIIISTPLPRLQLHFNKVKLVTLKHMVVRLLGQDYEGRKEAMTPTVKADMVDSDQSNDSLVANLWCWCLLQAGGCALQCLRPECSDLLYNRVSVSYFFGFTYSRQQSISLIKLAC